MDKYVDEYGNITTDGNKFIEDSFKNDCVKTGLNIKDALNHDFKKYPIVLFEEFEVPTWKEFRGDGTFHGAKSKWWHIDKNKGKSIYFGLSKSMVGTEAIKYINIQSRMGSKNFEWSEKGYKEACDFLNQKKYELYKESAK